jgi:hypothetical protein
MGVAGARTHKSVKRFVRKEFLSGMSVDSVKRGNTSGMAM